MRRIKGKILGGAARTLICLTTFSYSWRVIQGRLFIEGHTGAFIHRGSYRGVYSQRVIQGRLFIEGHTGAFIHRGSYRGFYL